MRKCRIARRVAWRYRRHIPHKDAVSAPSWATNILHLSFQLFGSGGGARAVAQAEAVAVAREGLAVGGGIARRIAWRADARSTSLSLITSSTKEKTRGRER